MFRILALVALLMTPPLISTTTGKLCSPVAAEATTSGKLCRSSSVAASSVTTGASGAGGLTVQDGRFVDGVGARGGAARVQRVRRGQARRERRPALRRRRRRPALRGRD